MPCVGSLGKKQRREVASLRSVLHRLLIATLMFTRDVVESARVKVKKKSPNAAVTKSPAAYEVIWDRALNTSRKKRKLIESGLLTSRGDIELVIDKEQEIHFCLEFTAAGPKHNNE